MTINSRRLAVCLLLALPAWQMARGQQSLQTSPAGKAPSAKKLDFFPVAAQFSAVPSGKGWNGHAGPIGEQEVRDTIDNMAAHGFTGVMAPTGRPKAEEDLILQYAQYAQLRGMFVTYEIPGGVERFGRDAPPATCVYSPNYAGLVRHSAESALAPLRAIPRLYNVFTYQDEPFHEGAKSFGYNAEVKAEFKKRTDTSCLLISTRSATIRGGGGT